MRPEQIQELLSKIERLQSIMINVATGKSRIQNENDLYQQLYEEIQLSFEVLEEEGLDISNPNIFVSLWEWYQYWSSNLNSYASRKKYIYDCYLTDISKLESYLETISSATYEIDSYSKLDISYFNDLVKKIEQIKAVMINVATNQSNVEDTESIYTRLYQDILLKIKNLNYLNISIPNPNNYRSLSHWHVDCCSQYQTYQERREYINNLYDRILSSIKKALQRGSLKGNSIEEFVEDLKTYFVYVPPQHIIQEIKPVNQSEAINSTQQIQTDISQNCNQFPQPVYSQKITDVVIITALEKERDAVLRYLDSSQLIQSSNQNFYKASIPTKRLDTIYHVALVCLHGMGSIKAGLTTQKVIEQFNPSHIILSGIAGGVPKENVRYLGDIIIGEQIVYYELAKQVQSQFGTSEAKPRYQVYRPSKILLDAAKNLEKNLDWISSIKAQRPDGTSGRIIPNIHFGVVASGDKVIADLTLRDNLQSDWSQLVGFEMEGAGAAIAAYESHFLDGILAIKGMCDWGDASKNDDWQEYAAESSASFIIELLKTAPFESKLRLNLSSTQEVHLKEQIVINAPPSEKVKVIQSSAKTYPGKVKLAICQRLTSNWEDLADYFDIPIYDRVAFDPGQQPRRVWEWLQERNRLDELEDALVAIGREDLLNELNN